MRFHARWCWRAAWSTALTDASSAGMTPLSSHSTTYSTVGPLTSCCCDPFSMIGHALLYRQLKPFRIGCRLGV